MAKTSKIKNHNRTSNGSSRIKKSTTTIGKKLEEIDQELFQYLQQNDKNLLDCEETDLDDSLESESDENEEDIGSFHSSDDETEKKTKKEERSEDDSDSNEDDVVEEQGTNQNGKITLGMVNAWEQDLQTNKRSIKTVAIIIKAFRACLMRVSGGQDSNLESEFRIDGSEVFNAVVRLCVTSLYPYLSKMMNLPVSSITKKTILNSKKWPYAKNTVRIYIGDLIKLMKNVSSEDILRVLLKHFHQMIPFATCLPTISKPILKQLISFWGTSSDDTVRVLSFLCILRFALSDPVSHLHTVLKKMYVSYVSNSKFLSLNTVQTVNFMRKSLTEMFSLNETISYNHAFLYIRQLAIHLRSAVITKKKESVQAVYNWQFMSSLRLWVDVLCNMNDKQPLNALIYPTTQIIIGCIKLIPTAQYFPLRFHCIQMLIKLTKETGIFIPILPFLVEVFSILNVNSHHKKLSMKPIDFTYILHLSKSQMQEIAFKDAVIEAVYENVLDYSAAECHRISFPDTIFLLQIQMKQFMKDCKNMNYTRKLKPLLEKIEEVSKNIIVERSKCGISLSDEKGIRAWESNMKLKSNPLTEYYQSWMKINMQNLNRKRTDKIPLSDYELPVLKKLPSKMNKSIKSKQESDTENDSGLEVELSQENSDTMERNQCRNKKTTKRKLDNQEQSKSKKKPKNDKTVVEEDSQDIVEDFNISKFLS